MITLYKIDADGFLVFGQEIHIETTLDDQGNAVYDVPYGYTDAPYAGGFYRPKLVDGVWVEDKAPWEFEEDELLDSLIPGADEIANAEFEIKILNILLELGVI